MLKKKDRTLSHIMVSGPFLKATFHANITYENEINEFRCEAQNNGIDSAQTSDAPLAQVIGELVVTFNPDNPQIRSVLIYEHYAF